MFEIHKKIIDQSKLLELQNWCLLHEKFSISGRWQGCNFKGGTKRISIFDEKLSYINDCFCPEVIPQILYDLRDLGKLITKAKHYYHPNCVCNIEFIHDGCFVPRHIDDNYGNSQYQHVRFNVLIVKPKFGGLPIIEDARIDIEAGDAWSFFANKHYHLTEIVKGECPRISMSFGYLGDHYC